MLKLIPPAFLSSLYLRKVQSHLPFPLFFYLYEPPDSFPAVCLVFIVTVSLNAWNCDTELIYIKGKCAVVSFDCSDRPNK